MIVFCQECNAEPLELYIDPAEPRAFHHEFYRPWCMTCLLKPPVKINLTPNTDSVVPT